jgi:hypothetical protein
LSLLYQPTSPLRQKRGYAQDLIYSDAFNALPAEAKTYLYHRLRDILTANDPGKDFVHLSPSDRKAVLEILIDTKPDFAALDKAVSAVTTPHESR